MAGVDFFQAPPDPNADPSGFARAQDMARMLQRYGATPQQGQTVGGHFVAPPPAAYAGQLASALAGGYRAGQLRDAQRASTILNGGTPQPPQPGLMQRIGGWFGGGSE